MTDSATSTTQPINEDNIQQWMKSYQECLANLYKGADEAPNGLRKVFLWLKTRNPDLDHIEITYDGGGDSGQVEDICCWSRNPEIPSVVDKVELDGMKEPLPDVYFDGEPEQHTECSLNNATREWEWSQPRNASPENLLDKLAWDLAYGKNPGFEINEGGYGTVRIGVSQDNPDGITVTLSHSERIIETNDYDYEF